ncbi:putative membrane protein [Variovorax sp. SRS16]|uniref:phage holin family protein n=1 Tax=Variovorax sp. SRS16 TaxID=282217 RepID=UPI001317773B|nr:phage holin family protein [Variovorax sp. SRS16]VTU16972.1 putative membrane protein [Variovorax sp. SRS16]
MRLLSLLGLDRYLRRWRIAAGEGALAAQDRVQLIQLAWSEEKKRLQLVLGLVIAVIGLTTIAIALLSVAVVVHFWDTPYRVTAAWSVAAVWSGLWLVAVLALLSQLRASSDAFEPARREFERDLAWFHDRFGMDHHAESSREARPASREELLARIERQRQRIATLQGSPADAAQAAQRAAAEAPPADESIGGTALRVAREHPVATGVATAAAVAVLGPRRLLRWAAVVVPVLWRMR